MSFTRPSFLTTGQPSRAHSLKARTMKVRLQQVPVAEEKARPVPAGRRGAPRLRLSIPARLVSLYSSHRCILIDLSCTGAQVGLEQPLNMDDTALIQIAGLEIFCEVVRSAQGPNGGVNGLVFDPPLREQDVLDMRAYAESYQANELQGLRSEVKDWVNGVV